MKKYVSYDRSTLVVMPLRIMVTVHGVVELVRNVDLILIQSLPSIR